MTDPDDMILRMERVIASPPEFLFALWLDPAQLVKWWAPDGYVAEVDALDARPGGRWRTLLRRPDGSAVASSGVYRVVEPPRRLAFTWAWEDAAGIPGHETEVSVRFEPTPGGTRLVLIQQRFETKQTRDNHDRGWAASFDRMRRIADDRSGTAPKPVITGSARSSYTRIVRMVCEEKGIDYTLTEAELGSPEIFAIHPFGMMPVLRHGDFAVCESKAIATYLDRAFPGPELIPSEPKLGALTDQWVSLVNTMMDPLLVRSYLLAYAFPRTADGKPDRALIDAMLPRVREQLALLDRSVAATGFLVGDNYTLADIYVMAILYYLRRLPESGSMLDPSTALGRYYQAHADRPSFVRTVPPHGPPRRYSPSG